jgi:hypothetical protein
MLLSGIAVLVVIALIVLATSLGDGKRPAEEMSRAGEPEFDSYAQSVKLTIIDKRTGERLNTRYGRIICNVENAGDKTLTGLQVRGAAIGFNNEVYKEKIYTAVPQQEESLGPNQRLVVDLYLEPIPDPSQVMEMTMELHGLKVRQ